MPPDRHNVWTAEIEWRQTEAGARFCVVARARDGTGEVTIAESRPLDWPPRRRDSVRALSDAAEELEAALLTAGWTPLPPGSAWYAKRFRSEPAAEAALLGPVAPAPPVWVQPVGPEAPAEEQPADPAPAAWDPPVAGARADGERSLVRSTFPYALVALLAVAGAVAGSLLARALVDGNRDAASDPSPSAAFFSRLPAVVEQLEAARSTGTRELAAATSAAEQAAAADRLARGHRAASAALAPLAATDAGLEAKLVAALDAATAAYTRLARAARARSPQQYEDARRAVAAADAALRRTLSQATAAAEAATAARRRGVTHLTFTRATA